MEVRVLRQPLNLVGSRPWRTSREGNWRRVGKRVAEGMSGSGSHASSGMSEAAVEGRPWGRKRAEAVPKVQKERSASSMRLGVARQAAFISEKWAWRLRRGAMEGLSLERTSMWVKRGWRVRVEDAIPTP
jgi:hypothetical protein